MQKIKVADLRLFAALWLVSTPLMACSGESSDEDSSAAGGSFSNPPAGDLMSSAAGSANASTPVMVAAAGTDVPGDSLPIGPRACECETDSGEFGTVSETIVVAAGETYDGECKIYRADPVTLGRGDQSEDQLPIFEVEHEATLRNVIIGASGADGVHVYGDVTLENIHWLDIGEDAMTVKASGTVNLDCGSSAKGEDKTFQINAASEVRVSNFTARSAGKFMRQNGGTTFAVDVYIDHCDIAGMNEVIFRSDSEASHVTLTNSRYGNLGKGLFMFGGVVYNGYSEYSAVGRNESY